MFAGYWSNMATFTVDKKSFGVDDVVHTPRLCAFWFHLVATTFLDACSCAHTNVPPSSAAAAVTTAESVISINSAFPRDLKCANALMKASVASGNKIKCHD